MPFALSLRSIAAISDGRMLCSFFKNSCCSQADGHIKLFVGLLQMINFWFRAFQYAFLLEGNPLHAIVKLSLVKKMAGDDVIS